MTPNLKNFFRFRNTNPDDPNDDRGLKTLAYVMLFGLITILFVSFYTASEHGKTNSFWPVLGLSLIIALAATICGGFMGFLFGIPRSLQRSSTEVGNGNVSPREKPYTNNTNLEQISDWLTKIIVGVSLTQLPGIERRFDLLCKSLSNGFSGYMNTSFSYPYSGCVIIFFSICGFLFVYLWAKIYLLNQLLLKEKQLDDVWAQQKKEIINTLGALQDKKSEIKDLENEINEFNITRNRLTTQENQPDIKEILDIAKPYPVTMVNDCQKNRWGSSSISGSYSATATINKENDTDENFLVTVAVSTTDPENSPIKGNVWFFLHDTFYPRNIFKEISENNTAQTVIGSFEAFTLGIVINNGAVKLELDLNKLENAPEAYKYKDELYTIDQLKLKLDEARAKERKEDDEDGE